MEHPVPVAEPSAVPSAPPLWRSSAARWRIGVVGMGRHALEVVKHFVEQSERWEILAVVDPSAAAFARFQSLFHAQHIPCYKTLADVDTLDGMDLMLVATTTPYHIRVACELIRRGYCQNIVIEKPVAQSLQQVDELLATIHENKWRGRIGIDFNRRCAPLYQPVHALVRAGTLGALKHMQFTRKCKISMKGSHFMDLALWFAEASPLRVAAKLGEFSTVDYRGASFFDPEGCIDVTFADGITFQLDATGTNPGYEPGMTLVLERGQIHINEQETLARLRRQESNWTELARDESSRLSWVENVCQALLSEKSPYEPCSLQDAIVNLELLVAAFQSDKNNGAPISVPLANEYRTLALQVA